MANYGNGYLWMGEGTVPIPVTLFAENRRRLAEKLRTHDIGNAIVLLQGGDDFPVYDTDNDFLFRQESYFMWTFGALEPACFGAVEVASGKSILFVPRLPLSDAIWMGPLWTPEDFKVKYEVDEVHFTDEIADILAAKAPSVLLTLNGMNSDSNRQAMEAKFEGIENFRVDNQLLFPEIAELRVIKTQVELEVMRYVAFVSSEAHRNVMQMVRPGISEYQCESEFLHHCYSVRGCRYVSYTCICGSGPNSSILHYGHAGAPNDRFIKEGDLCLFDMGANYFGYASDVTCTFPADGKFTEDQKFIYEAVLASNLAVRRAAAPGVSWVDMHKLASRVLLEHLRNGGLVRGEIDAMMEASLGYYFQPHGLGHLLGLDVHDVGGYLPGQPPRPTELGPNRLRFARILQEGMVVTVEPGCYFIDSLMDEILADEVLSGFVVPEILERFRGFGGVRIEDMVYITRNGVEDLTVVPRTVTEIEYWMSQGVNGKYHKYQRKSHK